jgi:signal transduction histidine kinase
MPSPGPRLLLPSVLDLALRSLRYPETGLAAVLAAVADELGAGVVAACAVPSDRPIPVLAVSSPSGQVGEDPRLDPEGIAPLLADLEPSVLPMPPGAAEPWSRHQHLGRAAATLPGGTCLRIVAAGDRAFDEEDLRAAAVSVAGLAAVVASARETEALRRDLHRLRQDRSLLASSLQHDLRTPLTSILGSARTLELHEGTLSDSDRHDLLRVIASQAERLASMVSEVFTREISGPDVPVKPRSADPQAVAERVAAAARVARGGEVIIQAEPALIVTDPDRLERALLNLVDNALKYSPTGEPVHVLGERTERSYAFTVADCGPGVAADVIPSLFAAFVTDRSRPGGTGLGLHSVVRLAKELGGRVSYSRTGQTTQFRLEIPDLGTRAHRSDEARSAAEVA